MNYAEIRALAEAAGFAETGLCGTEAFAFQRDTVSREPEIKERRQLHFDPQSECPWATALLVLLWPYIEGSISNSRDAVFVDPYYAASNKAYHAGKKLEDMLRQAGFHAKANVSYPAKAAAVRAGLGLIGDNGLLITPKYGSRVVIIMLATDAIQHENGASVTVRECLHCGRCAKACPAGAIDDCGVLHPARCLRNHMMEGTVVPEEARTPMGMRLIGCDTCQRVCPMQSGHEKKQIDEFMLDHFMTTDEAAFKSAVARLADVIGRNAARPQRVRAQAALLAGNRKKIEHLEVLRFWEKSEHEAVRAHAKWAIEQFERHAQGLDQNGEKR